MVKIIENEMNFVIMITDHAWFSINKFDKREEIALVIEDTDRHIFLFIMVMAIFGNFINNIKK